MSIKVRANVKKIDGWWLTLAYTDGESVVPSQHAWSKSHPEAMQSAYLLMSVLDAQLMELVHASRASRRQAVAA